MTGYPFDYVYQAINAAKGRLNDTLPTLEPLNRGILETNQDFTQQMMNNAWRRVQRRLVAKGFSVLIDEVILTIPAITNLQIQTGSQLWIDWNGSSWADIPFLPASLIQPLYCEELPTQLAANNISSYKEMDKIDNGLPAVAKKQWLEVWEWRNNKLYLLGALLETNLRIRFAQYFPDFLDVIAAPLSVVRWFNQQIPIMRAADAIGWYACSEYATARKVDPSYFDLQGDAAADQIGGIDVAVPASSEQTMRDAKMKVQRV